MIRSFLNLFSKNDSLDYILQPTKESSPKELLRQAKAIEPISGAIAETVLRIIEVVYGELPEDKNKAARRVLITLSSELDQLIGLIDEALSDEPQPGNIYQVQSGDTLSKIANMFDTTIGAILLLNPAIENPNLIHPGQILLIPKETKPVSVPTPSPEPQPAKLLRPGIWGINGQGVNQNLISQMLSWKPTAITCISDHLAANGVYQYKADNPDVKIIVRYMHPQNWRENIYESAKNWGRELAGKYNEIEPLNPYLIPANEVNLGYESGSNIPAFEDEGFYRQFGEWFGIVADELKGRVPEAKLICPPFAPGHNEDGVPENGIPKIGWSGYQYLKDTIATYCDNIIGFHGYWGDHTGRIADRLYHPELSTWYAFRWERVFDLFKIQWGMDVKFIIDEAGSFDASHPDFPKDIEYYSANCLGDSRILALTWFLWHDPTQHPGNIPNSWTQKMNNSQLETLVQALRIME